MKVMKLPQLLAVLLASLDQAQAVGRNLRNTVGTEEEAQSPGARGSIQQKFGPRSLVTEESNDGPDFLVQRERHLAPVTCPDFSGPGTPSFTDTTNTMGCDCPGTSTCAQPSAMDSNMNKCCGSNTPGPDFRVCDMNMCVPASVPATPAPSELPTESPAPTPSPSESPTAPTAQPTMDPEVCPPAYQLPPSLCSGEKGKGGGKGSSGKGSSGKGSSGKGSGNDNYDRRLGDYDESNDDGGGYGDDYSGKGSSGKGGSGKGGSGKGGSGKGSSGKGSSGKGGDYDDYGYADDYSGKGSSGKGGSGKGSSGKGSSGKGSSGKGSSGKGSSGKGSSGKGGDYDDYGYGYDDYEVGPGCCAPCCECVMPSSGYRKRDLQYAEVYEEMYDSGKGKGGKGKGGKGKDGKGKGKGGDPLICPLPHVWDCSGCGPTPAPVARK